MQPMQLLGHLKGTMDEKVILQHLKGGSRGAGPIPGGATLIFAVEYLGE